MSRSDKPFTNNITIFGIPVNIPASGLLIFCVDKD